MTYIGAVEARRRGNMEFWVVMIPYSVTERPDIGPIWSDIGPRSGRWVFSSLRYRTDIGAMLTLYGIMTTKISILLRYRASIAPISVTVRYCSDIAPISDLYRSDIGDRPIWIRQKNASDQPW